MRITSIRNKSLGRFIEKGDASKLDKRLVEKLRVQLTFLIGMEHSRELNELDFWKAHRLSDARWSFHVTANFRLTFAVDDEVQEISILDLEDYH